MRNRIVRAPASLAVKCTFTVVGSPSLVSAISCVLRMRPESSTLSGTVVPRNPLCDTMTSTERFVPFSTLRGVLTRLI